MTLEELRAERRNAERGGLILRQEYAELFDLAEAMLMLEEMRRPTLRALGWAKEKDRFWNCDVSSHYGDDQATERGAAAAIRAAHEGWKKSQP